MSPSPFTPALKRKFAADVWPWALSALWQDTFLWNCLETTELGSRALAALPGEPGKWTPASLAILDLQLPLKVEEVRSLPTRSIASATLRLARHTGREWEALRADPDLRLGQVGLLALALLERGESTSWRRVWADSKDAGWLVAGPPSLSPASTLVACLYDLVPEPLEMLRALVANDKEGSFASALCVNAILCQPMPPAQQIEAFIRLLEGMGSTAALNTLQSLFWQRQDLAQQVACNLPAAFSAGEGLEDIGRIGELMQTADVESLKGEYKQAVPHLEKALENTRRLQARLAARIGEVANQANDPAGSLAAWKQAVSIDTGSPYLASELALALSRSGQTAKAKSYLSAREAEMPGHTRISLAEALVSRQSGDIEKAVRYGIETLQELYSHPGNEWEFEAGNPLYRVGDLAQMFLDLGRPVEAAQAADLALRFSRQADGALNVFIRSHLEQGDAQPALAPAHLLAALHPEQGAFQQLLVETLESAEAWDAALEERQSAIQKRPSWQPVTSREWRGLAHSALRSGKLDQTIAAAREALKLNAEDDASYGLLGEAYRLLGDLPAARDHFWQATQLAPHEADHWLALSVSLEQLDQPEKVVETLRAASQAAPQAPQVHLALGEALLKEHSPSQALPVLRRAADLLEEGENRNPAAVSAPLTKQRKNERRELSRRAALGLGSALYQLGHFGEAEQVLSSAYAEADENDIETAYSFARVLLSLGDVRRALAPLERVVRSNPSDPVLYLAYGRALLQSGEHPQEEAQLAVPVLKKALELEEHAVDLETQGLLAEALMGAGELNEAQEAFRQALNNAQQAEPAQRARLSAGFGKVSLRLGQFDTAIAALQEAALANPQSGGIQRDLSEAFLAQGLSEEAIAAARHALRRDPSSLDTLVWFAGQAPKYQTTKADQKVIDGEALQAWERSVQLAPERGDLLVSLAQANLQTGNRQTAAQVLETVIRSVRGETDAEASPLKLRIQDLHKAARLHHELGDREAAILLLRTAAQRLEPATSLLPEEQAALLGDLAAAQSEAGLPREAMESIDRGLSLAPDLLALKLKKAALLVDIGEEADALAFIEMQLRIVENRTAIAPAEINVAVELAALHRQAALILWRRGDLATAQIHAEEAVDQGNAPSFESLYLAASLARARYQSRSARDIASSQETNLPGPLACLAGELAFDAGDQSSARDLIDKTEGPAQKHPRYLCLQSRLFLHTGDLEQANRSWEAAVQALQLPEKDDIQNGHTLPDADRLDTWLAFGEAAIERQQWELGIHALELAATASPITPLVQRQLGRALVLRAEAQRLCETVECIAHAPGPAAYSQGAYTAFQTAIQSLIACQESVGSLPGDDKTFTSQQCIQKEVNRWRNRGEAVFHPSVESARALAGAADSAEDTAALMAALRLTGDDRIALKAAQDFPAHPAVILQMALVVGENSPTQALSVLSSLIAPAVQQSILPHDQAIALALAARLALKANDFVAARQAILAALQIYPNEPRWHSLAAQVLWRPEAVTAADWSETLEHLQTAARLEPDCAAHYLALGKAQAASGDIDRGLSTLEKAVELAPGQADAWIALAQAQVESGNLQAAGSSAEKAVEIAPDPSEALLLRGEIALMTNNPRGAISRVQSILRTQPGHTGALQILAEAYDQMERYEEALEILNQVIPLLDHPLEYELKRARLLRQVRGKAENLQALQAMDTHYPENAIVQALYAEALLENGQPQAAVQVAREALQGGPGEIGEDLRGRLHYLIGRQQRLEGQLDESIHHLTEAILLTPDTLEAYLELGLAHHARRQEHQALNIFQKAIQIAPNDPRAYYQAGMALKESKDYLGAEAMLRKAAGLAPDDVSIHRLLGAVVALNLVHNRRPEYGSES